MFGAHIGGFFNLQTQRFEIFAQSLDFVIGLIGAVGKLFGSIHQDNIETIDQFLGVLGYLNHFVRLVGNHVADFGNAAAGLGRNRIETGDVLLIIGYRSAPLFAGIVCGQRQVFGTLIQAHVDLFNVFNRVFGRLGYVFAYFQQPVTQNVELIGGLCGSFDDIIGIFLEFGVDFAHFLSDVGSGVRQILILLGH